MTFFVRLPVLLLFLVSLTLITVASFYAVNHLTFRWAVRDITLRGAVLTNAFSDTISHALAKQEGERIEALFERAVQDEKLIAIGFCSPTGALRYQTTDYPVWMSCQTAQLIQQEERPQITLGSETAHVGVFPVKIDKDNIGELVIIHSLEFAKNRVSTSRQHLFIVISSLTVVCILIMALVLRQHRRYWSLSLQRLLHESNTANTPSAPWMHDLRTHLRDIEDSCRHLGTQAHLVWDAERLQALLKGKLSGEQVIALSNHQPFSHIRTAEGIQVIRQASGLISALEPVLSACGGTWIAHGNGTADAEKVDNHDRVVVTGGAGGYTLRRLWLSAKEHTGYYAGFANGGIWPLCHMAHVRPVFRETDWQYYQRVNQRFADAVLEEARCKNPIVLVQDYQLALAPAMIRRHLPDATIISFWHIPWPNADAFSICPWRHEILQGLLGSTIIGFQTAGHRQSFLASVDRFLEARIEHDRSSVFCNARETLIQTYPISIAWPAQRPPTTYLQDKCLERLKIPADKKIILGVDRFDYIKGIEERLLAFEHLLDKHEALRHIVHFVQIASPTRDMVRDYSSFQQRVRALVAHINARFTTNGQTPVITFIEAYQDADTLCALYRSAQVCVVSSLHDGMNLVSKEFVAAREDEQGVLILSCFTGAALELREALIVNPYLMEELTDAMLQALQMSEAEQRERMICLRQQVQDANVFNWAANMLSDAERWRLRERAYDRIKRYSHLQAG